MECDVLKKKQRIILVFSVFFFFQLFLIPEYSTYGEGNSPTTMYEVKPLLNEDQKNMGIDYFYFNVQPNDNKEIFIEIINHADISEIFEVQINEAVTNSNGFIDYSIGKKTSTTESKVDFDSVVDNTIQSITVEAHGTKKVSFTLKIPEREFEGILLGGIYVSKQETENQNANDESKEGLQIKQSLAYAVAIMLQERIPYTEGKDLRMHSLKVDVSDNQSILTFSLENPHPNILNKVQMITEIYKDGEEIIYATLKKENMSFSPNDLFDLKVPWDQTEIIEGEYRAVTVFTSGEEHWEFEYLFSVTKEDIVNIEKNGSSIVDSKDQYYVNIIISVLLILIIYLLTVVLKKGSDKK